jgi:preprotein translocase subunit SecB
MADTPQPPTPAGTPPATPPGAAGAAGANSQAGAQANPPRLLVQTQYVKDLSFENPRAPTSLEPGNSRPEIQVRVDVRAQPLAEERYEVGLELRVEAKAGDDPTFMLELTYCGVFALVNVPKETRQALLLIECPRLLFPFARRIIADASRDGGFPPLMIDPIDFMVLFRRRQQQAQAAAAPAGAAISNPIVGDGSAN